MRGSTRRPVFGLFAAALSLTLLPAPAPALANELPPPLPEQVYEITGGGNAHGVGMSQYGAYGRAVDKQPYAEILAHYYHGTSLGTQPTDLPIRVLLASGFNPTDSEPARVEARKANSAAAGTWYSDAFPDMVFPAGSYAEMRRDPDGTWVVTVRDGQTGEELAAAATDDFLMQPTDAGTLFYMKFRDSLRRYDVYRGEMRMRVTSIGLQAINILGMDDYVRGVVPGEMPASWPARAKRAQAVAARR
jgi:stage II sporulation protein D